MTDKHQHMKPTYLLPHRFKWIGWVVLIPASIAGLLVTIFEFNPPAFDLKVPALFINEIFGKKQVAGMIENNVLNELIGILIIISSMFVAFSKEKIEDEYISRIRLDSLAWAVYFNQAILLLSIMFIYDLSFLWVMIFNMFTLPWFFIIRFTWLKRNINKIEAHEE